MPLGVVMKGIGGFYYIKSPSYGIVECKARGIFRKDDIIPLPGDKVSFSIVDTDKNTGLIEEILPRTSELVRPAVANVTQLVVVVAIKSPQPDFLLLDKMLITASIKDIKPVILINKIDKSTEEDVEKVKKAYENTGYKMFFLSAKTHEGFDELMDILKDKITVFAGQSGVGKSTILNRLAGSVLMETGEVSDKIERGRHTTRHAELFDLPNGGLVVDTPGFSSFELAGVELNDLELHYPEFENHLGRCRFNGCSHINEPDCVVKEAVVNGDIDNERYERFVHFYCMLKKQKDQRYRK
ncbi:MAG TPA: ribosome small subunit-dependent GTPase A [Pseudobacteroides sp.]|uniref:ribosome small subunit-dependent GTPase A n=1 Tax=Pseudobacteroides sp. TaxID=1968840 RepID=UPI002F95E22A